jgi:hypothetical protein
MKYLLFIVEAPDDYGLKNLADDIVNVLHGPQFSSVELIERSAPLPLYRAKLPADRQARDEHNNKTRLLKADDMVFVYQEVPVFADSTNGKYEDRVVITPPGYPVEHIWDSGLIVIT